MTRKIQNIEFIQGLLADQAWAKEIVDWYSSRIAIISDAVVAKLYGGPLLDLMRQVGAEVYLFTFPEGESHKNRETKARVEDAMMENGLGRDTLVIGLGGGVATDMAGFAAATYARGVPLIMIPTTILGMVDASIGGKNGVDTRYGKKSDRHDLSAQKNPGGYIPGEISSPSGNPQWHCGNDQTWVDRR